MCHQDGILSSVAALAHLALPAYTCVCSDDTSGFGIGEPERTASPAGSVPFPSDEPLDHPMGLSVDTGLPAAPQPPVALVPVTRPVLQGKITELPQLKSPHQRQHVYEGKWAMSEEDSIWGRMRYTFNISANAPLFLPPPGLAAPANPALPSAVDHQKVSLSMSGSVNMADPKLPPIADKLTLKIGGIVPTEALLPVVLEDGSTAAMNSLVGISGESSIAGGRFTVWGAYHAATGTCWLRKFPQAAKAQVKSSAPKPKPAPVPSDGMPKPAPVARAKSVLGGLDPLVETPREPRQVRSASWGL
jgi:hypothetical protein